MIKYNGVYQQMCNSNATFCDYQLWRRLILDSIDTPQQFDEICNVTQKPTAALQLAAAPRESSLSLRDAVIALQSAAIVLLALFLARSNRRSNKRAESE